MRTETKWALIASAIIFIWLCIEKMLGLLTVEKISTWATVDFIASMLIFIFIYYMVTREKREHDLQGIMSWKQGFWAAAIMTLIFIPISTLLVYIFVKAVCPEFPHIFMEYATKGSIEKDPVNFFLKTHVMFAIIGGLLFSALFPLLNKKAAAA